MSDKAAAEMKRLSAMLAKLPQEAQERAIEKAADHAEGMYSGIQLARSMGENAAEAGEKAS